MSPGLPRGEDDGRLALSPSLPAPHFTHLRRMTDLTGLWEHARYTTPRVEHGYCTDDNARALVVVCRQPDPGSELIDLTRIYLKFLQDAALPGGGFHNRRNADGSWADGVGSDDSQGRAIWGLGVAARLAPEDWIRSASFELFERQTRFDPPSLRASSFALFGAAEVLAVAPGHAPTRQAIERWSGQIRVGDDPSWPWPERRLAYDNARIPEAIQTAGVALEDDRLVDSGIRLLEWLVATQTRGGHFSYAPSGGWGSGEPRPGFDQQPVETAAMADACSRAFFLTGDDLWRHRVVSAARWLLGDNDGGTVLYDVDSGGCCDGLTPTGVNLNQGAESTLSALIALQQAIRCS